MKRVFSVLVLCCLLLSFAFPVMAEPPKIVDGADLLTEAEEQGLEERAAEIAGKYEMDVVILTVDSTDGQFIESYADDYYDKNGYGLGAEYSGVLLMLAMDTREWAISTCGEGIYALTDSSIQTLFSDISWELSEDRYYDAFLRYLEGLETYYEAYACGDPIDNDAPEYDGPGSYESGTQDVIIHYEEPPKFRLSSVIILSLVIGAIIAAVALWIMSRGMKTARRQSGAVSYLVDGSMHFLTRQDFFLYSRTSRTAKPQDHGSGGRSSSGRGGSSVHRSSSGRSHGGGHGRF